MSAERILNLDGIPSASPRRDGHTYFTFDPQGSWRISKGSRFYDIEARCVSLHEAFKRAIMKGVNYSELIYWIPGFVYEAGHSAEAKVSRQDFEQLLTLAKDIPEMNRFLYLYDCQHLVASIQECTKEVEQILGEFYLAFNMEPFFYPLLKHEDGIRYSSSPVTTKLSAYLGFLFIRMHSLLDYTVKVAFEAEHLRQDFSRYTAGLNSLVFENNHGQTVAAQLPPEFKVPSVSGIERLRLAMREGA